RKSIRLLVALNAGAEELRITIVPETLANKIMECIATVIPARTYRIVVPLPDAGQNVEPAAAADFHKLEPRWHGVDCMDERNLQRRQVIRKQSLHTLQYFILIRERAT